MAEDRVNEPASSAGHGESLSAIPFLIAFAALAVPGLGHLWLRRWVRGVLFLVAAGGLAVLGYLMRGQVFSMASGDPFGRLGFLADACTGVFYVLSRWLETTGPNLSRATGDYGTRFLASAGIVNLIGALDAYAIARGQRR